MMQCHSPRMNMLMLKSTPECSWHDWRAHTLAEGKMNAEKTRGAARQFWTRILMEASYELKFELQVQVMRLISGAHSILDC
jgi:hypothetical protein